MKDRSAFGNKAYNSDKFREMQPKELSHGRKNKLVFDARNLAYWDDYFCRYDAEQVQPEACSTAVSKAEKLHEIRSKNCHIVE